MIMAAAALLLLAAPTFAQELLEAFRAAPAEAGYTPLPPREPISGR